MPVEKTLNPFDVEGLEKSLSDSATRVSTIWISYLLFGLYLLVSAGTATHKQLLLAEPVKLPALSTEVPLVAFFVIAPLLFVLLQFYVLLQTLLLGRTARAYNDAVNRTLRISKENAIFRERLANTIFAQIFAGAPRERKGWVGRVLRGISWFTLLGSPIVVLLAFQLAFLPYHSQGVTWFHRALIFVEIVIAFTVWPMVVNPKLEFAWLRLDLRFWRSRLWSRRQSGRIAAIIVLLVSTFVLSFPGEWHINLLALRSFDSRACKTWLTDTFYLDYIDRLKLNDVGVADADTLTKMIKDKPEGVDLHKAARSRDLSGRAFDCGVFNGVDFRLAALDRSQFQGSRLDNARLDGARMTEVSLEGAELKKNTFDQIDLTGAHLTGAILSGATLNKVEFGRAELFGIDLSGAFFTDVRFGAGALLSGANLIGLRADELKVPSGHLEGVGLQYSTIQKLDLSDANLDGADFFKATVPIDVSKYDKTKSLFYEMQADWDSNPKKQVDFADAVAKTVCAADTTDTNNSKRVSKIVAAIITNSLYPRGGANACPKTGPNQCPPEQPAEYRKALADKLADCVAGVLTLEDIQSLKSGSDVRSHRR